jgi:hypothetical protein
MQKGPEEAPDMKCEEFPDKNSFTSLEKTLANVQVHQIIVTN